MQIMIDVHAESPQSLRMLAKLLLEYAVIAEKDVASSSNELTAAVESLGAGPLEPEFARANVYKGVIHENVVEPPRAVGMLPALVADYVVPTAAPALDPSTIGFGQGQVIPFPKPTVPTAPTATAPASSTASPILVPVPAFVPVPLPSAVIASTSSAPAGAVETDSAGIPYDARIHNSGRTKKVDGTWKIQRGLDKDIVVAVMSELTGVRGTPGSPVLLPSAPSPVPVPVPPLGVPKPPVDVSAGAVPVPPVTANGGLLAFRAMMTKISAGLEAGRITNVDVANAHKDVGLTGLQLAVTRSELIPQILAKLGL